MKTIEKTTQSNLEVMKSKFISILMPLENPDDFKIILKNLQKEHSKAKHIVYAKPLVL